ncbi:hypothetical protein WICPIJ_008055 [Wickerhamomyces pijperi]|uniref:Uncharacterized protein n=1 Tax=Wickerhamomyces pijperi TaxID=599730 RepID=A0A9P8Q0K8_WICPI|nr:hypothetical protein WICPIJ_008055 [Wickerhamomyces pijperi]
MSRYGDSLGSDFNIPGSFSSPKQRHKQLSKQLQLSPQLNSSDFSPAFTPNKNQLSPFHKQVPSSTDLAYQVQRNQRLEIQTQIPVTPIQFQKSRDVTSNSSQRHRSTKSQPINGSPLDSQVSSGAFQSPSAAHKRDNSMGSQRYLQYIPPSSAGSSLGKSQGGDHLHQHAHKHSHFHPFQHHERQPSTTRDTAAKSTSTKTSNMSDSLRGSEATTALTSMKGLSSVSKPISPLPSPNSVCAKCQQPITTKSVRALGKRYHLQCFGCHDCDTPFLKKYFPFEVTSGEQIPLCEEHFYKRRGLLCCVCDKILNSTHYTIFGRKYDVEHFCCSICKKRFDTEEEFFNHDGSLYCHYHFSKFFVDRCEGCEFAILKQYVEIFRGGKNQKWHVECYMINKLWNIQITPRSIGITQYFDRVEPTPENIQNSKDINPSPEELLLMEQKSSRKILEIWKVLLDFEGKTAGCISDMLQYATFNDQQKALQATTRLVLKIECLFKALEALHRLGIQTDSEQLGSNPTTPTSPIKSPYQMLKREPRNLSAKIMVYLSILRNGSKPNSSKTETAKQDMILSAATGLAHYLKLLIRNGLHNALQFDKLSSSSNALDKFLREVSNHTRVPDDVFECLDVTIEASELCFACHKNIESECLQYKGNRWHIDCLKCSSCEKHLSNYNDVLDASFDERRDLVLCGQCSVNVPEAKDGFKIVSKLLQLIYLLKIAIIRSKVTFENSAKNRSSPTSDTEANGNEGYIKSVNEIQRLKSTRQNEDISTNSNEALGTSVRKSFIMESSDLTKDDLLKHRITIEDEPLSNTSLSKGSFKRAANFITTQKVLTLDDISRIVAAEHARELRPHTYKYHDPHQDAPGTISKDIRSKSNSLMRGAPSIHNSIEATKTPNNGASSKDTKYYSELTDNEKFVLSHGSVVLMKLLIQKFNIKLDVDYNKLIELKKQPSFWDKLRGIGSDKKSTPPLVKVFGSELKDLSSKTGVESSQSNSPSKIKIPMVIEDLLTALYQKDMSIEGIFRKNGDLKKLKELIAQVDSDPSKVPNLLNENPIQLSALLKKFLREMPTPLLTFNLYELWIQSQKLENESIKSTFIELIYSLLPGTHRDLAEVLLFFFMWASSFAHLDETNGSKMDIHNLATVLSPNILYADPTLSVTSAPNSSSLSKGSGSSSSASTNPAQTYMDAFKGNEGENYYLAIEVVDYLISHNEELAVVPTYLLQLCSAYFTENVPAVSNFDKVTSKDLFQWIEGYFEGKDIIDIVRINGSGEDTDKVSEGDDGEKSNNLSVIKESNSVSLETDIEN